VRGELCFASVAEHEVDLFTFSLYSDAGRFL
jgi:hypothetical protein